MKKDKNVLGEQIIADEILRMSLDKLKILNKRISGLIHKKATAKEKDV